MNAAQALPKTETVYVSESLSSSQTQKDSLLDTWGFFPPSHGDYNSFWHPDYSITIPIGKGGMGVVYLAYDSQGNECALKVNNSQSQEKSRHRFNREIEALKHLKHPHIVEFFQGNTDSPYFTMEYLDGATLNEFETPKTPEEILELLEYTLQIGQALSYIHAEGLIYRDVKPENVMVIDDSAKLVDFGLVRDLPSRSLPNHYSKQLWGDLHLTCDDEVVGTPLTMAPEYVFGASGLSQKNDTYSLAASVYKALTGKYPLNAKSTEHLFLKKTHEDPRPACDLNDLISPALSKGLDKALEKNPSKRMDLDSLCDLLDKEAERKN